MQKFTSHLEIRISQKNHLSGKDFTGFFLMIEEKRINLSFSTTHLSLVLLYTKHFHSLIDLLHRNEHMIVKMGPHHHPSDAWCPSNFRPIIALGSEPNQ